jgi:hypothetical protein
MLPLTLTFFDAFFVFVKTLPQRDRTNWYHPLGFAYFPDGAHDGKDELEPGIVPPGSASTCGEDMSCPAPMYLRNGGYLGDYSNLNSTEKTQNKTDFGLDHYEPLFFHPIGDWLGYELFEILLTFDVEDFNDDMFYFCHVSCAHFARSSTSAI